MSGTRVPKNPPDKVDVELASDADLDTVWRAHKEPGDSPPVRDQITVEQAQAAARRDSQ
jgi:hypothetical protein